MKRLTGHTDIGDSLLDEIAFINPDDAEGLYNLREIAQHGSDELLYEIANRLAVFSVRLGVTSKKALPVSSCSSRRIRTNITTASAAGSM